MSAIPTSDIPGHRQLHERACTALDRCQESQGVEFKESATWDLLQWKIVKTTLAMANLRDGGIIVIGASERNQVWDLTGVSKLHLATYDVDSILDKANSYASPIVDLDIVTLTYSNGNTFLVIQVREFTDAPVVCKKNGPEGLVEGGLYIRPPGLARTTRMTSTVQMHELLDLASEKRARRILEQGRRVGLVPVADDRFDRELEGL